MAIPDFQSIMLPLLTALTDGQLRSTQQLDDALGPVFKLTEDERNALLPSGTQSVFRNRIGWANSYMRKAGLIESPKRGWMRITPAGQQVLAEKPARIDIRLLRRFPSFLAFQETKREDGVQTAKEPNESQATPFEALEAAFGRIQAQLQDELLDQVKAMSPRFFERLVVDLLVKMGYGGNFRDAAMAVGRSKDGGIDGIIKEDKLGLDTIYLQAKRWSNTVGRPEIQQFAGALQGRRARKGVFLTTSTFSAEAVEFSHGIEKIVLIDGPDLARLMIEYDLGVSRIESFDVKKIDSDYFIEQ